MRLAHHHHPTLTRVAHTNVALAVLLFAAAPGASAQTSPPPTPPLKIEPGNVVLCAGESASFHASRETTAVEVEWTIEPPIPGASGRSRRAPMSRTSDFTYTAPQAEGTVARVGEITVTAQSTGPDQKAQATIELAGACDGPFGGELARFTVGYEQIGAAGIDGTQRYSFDVYMSRPLPIFSERKDSRSFYFGPPLRWWGDVRVGSYPQQVNAEVAKFATGFAGSAGKLKVNELVRSAEFQTGLEVRLWASATPRHALTENTQQRFALMAFAGWGGIGPLPPVSSATVFTVPTDDKSPQFAAFKAAYPDVTSTYVAFVPPSSSRFLEQASVGVRLYTFSVAGARREPQASAPALVEVSYGKNELVSDGRRVLRASAFYPFAFGDRTKPDTVVIYFFGDALMARGTGDKATALFLNPALDDANAAIPLANANVTIVSSPSNNRDTYRVGVAIDLMRLWKRLSAPAGGQS